MNAHTMAHRAYSQTATTTKTDRRKEYEMIARVTHRLRKAAVKGKPGFPKLVEALYDNRRLWTAFAVDISDSQNRLPDGLRAQIFYLAEFTQAHTSRILAGKAGVKPIIEVNMAILKGLNPQGAAT